ENPFARVAQGTVQIHADDHLAAAGGPAEDTELTRRGEADAAAERRAVEINRIQSTAYHRAANQGDGLDDVQVVIPGDDELTRRQQAARIEQFGLAGFDEDDIPRMEDDVFRPNGW